MKTHAAFQLGWTLLEREIKGQYRRSLLGSGWIVLQPLLYLVIFGFLRMLLGIPSDGIPYLIFLYSGLAPWLFFANALPRMGQSITANAAVIKKTSVAREIFPIVAVVMGLIDFAVAMVFMAVLMIWYQVPVGWSLLWTPVLIVMLALFALGIGMTLAAIGTFKKDMLLGLPFLLMFWMLASPIVYPMSLVPRDYLFWYQLNPMVGIIEGFRSVLVKGHLPDLSMLGISAMAITVICLIGWPLFRRNAKYFADVI